MKRVAVIGVGHFGREHARIYSTSANANLVAVCDIDQSVGSPVAKLYGATFVSDFRELIGKVDAVSLAVPTAHHHSIACELLDSGIAVLVEKPIACSIEEADEMIGLAARSKVLLQVGTSRTLQPGCQGGKRHRDSTRFFEAHRLSIFTPRSLDIDVVMDLMIHDIDVVLSFAGSDVTEIRAAGVPILTPRIDIANARLSLRTDASPT